MVLQFVGEYVVAFFSEVVQLDDLIFFIGTAQSQAPVAAFLWKRLSFSG